MPGHPPGFFDATEMPTAGWWEALWPARHEIATAVGISPDIEVVDLCSGDGWFTLQIAKLAHYVVAIDIEPKLLETARHRLAENNVTNCSFVPGNAYDLLKLLGHPTDFVFMANVFHGVPDKRLLCRAVYEALRPGGHFAIVNWHRQPRERTTVLGEPRGPRTELRMTPEDTIAAVTPARLDPLKVVDLPPYHYAAIFERPSL
jgi:SAM-dependent methyltransferase